MAFSSLVLGKFIPCRLLIYLSYFMNNSASLNARLKSWPRDKAPFSLGRWGIVINIAALLYGGLMIINFLWFGGLRNVYTNPTIGTAFPGLNNLPAIGSIPIFEFSLIVLLVIGAIYWFGFKRRHVIANGEVGFDPATSYGTSQQD